jgi:radical SAM protein with 4Fe4S-binding SPASM domain
MPVPSDAPDWAQRTIPVQLVPAGPAPRPAHPAVPRSARVRLKQRLVVLASTRRLWAAAVGLSLGIVGALRGRRGSWDHLKSTLSLARGSTVVAGRPMNVTIEPTNACNLGCPVCETGDGTLGRETGHMAFDDFRTIVDKIAAHTNTLMFYFMGEPFLNKRAYAMIRYAKDAGIPFIDTCTNGDFVDPAQIVACGLDRVSFQIGGMTQETHEVYRVRSRLDRVLRNLEETLALRRERGSPLRVESGFILMKHNEHEVDLFRRRMEELGIDRASVIDPVVRTVDQGKAYLPTDRERWLYDETAFANGLLRPKILPENVCPWIHYSMAIHVNGNVVPCCRDPRGAEVMGNLVAQGLEEIWNGSAYRDLRARIQRDQGSVEICRLCSSYPVSVIR